MSRFPLAIPALLSLALTAPLFSASYTSTANGLWTDSATWGGSGTPTASADTAVIAAGTEVTAGSGVNYTASGSLTVNGTLNVGAGAYISIADFQIQDSPPANTASVLNMTGGTVLIRSNIPWRSNSPTYTFNISGGSLLIGGNIAAVGLATLNLSGTGHISVGGTNGMSRLQTWQGGSFVTKGQSINNAFLGLVDANAANKWILSDQTTKQTFTNGNTALSNNAISQGAVVFGIYSATNNDNDQIAITSSTSLSNARLGFTSGARIELAGMSLTGTAASYDGTTYQLFDYSLYTGSDAYSGIQATVASTVLLNIGGADYTFAVTNNLSTLGSITLNLMAVPEASTFALLAGFGALGFAGLRRRR